MPQLKDDRTSFALPADLRTLWHVLVDNVRWIALTVAVAGLIGGIYLVRTGKTFAATTTVQVEQEQRMLVKADAQRADGRAGDEVLKTIEQNLQNPALFLRLIRRDDFAHDPAFLPGTDRAGSESRMQDALKGKITVNIRRGTRLIDITVEDSNPAMAQKIANALVDEFIRANSESRSHVSQGAHEFLRQEAERLKATLAKSEESLQRYKKLHQAVSLEEKQNIIVERLKELNQRVTTAKAERLKLEADCAQLRELAGQPPERLLALGSVAGSAEVADVLRKIGEKDAEIGTLSRRYKPEHPKCIEAAGALAELKARLNEAIVSAADLVTTAFEAAQTTEGKLEEALRGQESLALELSEMAIPHNALAREVASDRALYESLLARLKETDVAQGVSEHAIRIASPALLPERPVRPNKKAVLLLSLLGGLTLGITGVLGRHMMDDSLRTVDQAEQILGLPSLAAIPGRAKTKLGDTARLLAEKPQTAVAEAFRTLRTTLQLTAKEGACRTLLFASAIPGEGKSFCSLHYALALAQQGFSTLLIDADLRLPSVSRVFLGEARSIGMTDILRERCGFDEAVHPTEIANLSVLPAGTRVPNVAEIAGQSGFAGVIRAALAQFDRVVIDTAPVHAVSDTLFFARHADAVCIVVAAGRTPFPAVKRAVQKLRESGGKVAGFILNGLPAGHSGYYYHYHSPGYGADEVYGATTEANS